MPCLRPCCLALAALLAVPGPLAAAEGQAAAADWLGAAAGLAGEGFAPLPDGWALTLPADHAPHPEAATEVWQVWALLRDPAGAPAGVQLSLLRLGLAPPGAPTAASDWAARELWRGHAVVQSGAGPAAGEERLGRGMAGVAGAEAEGLRLDDWTLALGAGGAALEARAGAARARLRLTPQRPPAAVAAADLPFRGYALTSMAAEGVLDGPDGPQAVTGTAWVEHLWGELPLPGAGPVASDRLILQLADGATLSLLRTRRLDGRGLPTVEGVLIAPDGTAAALEAAGFAEEDGPGWRLQAEGLDLALAPVTEAAAHGFAAPVWIGLVTAEGTQAGRPVGGLGLLQRMGEGPR